MSDESKRKLIRFLNKVDGFQGKGRPRVGWDDETKTRDESAWRRQIDDELSGLSGAELDRELRRQLLATLPMAIVLLAVIVLAVRMLAS